MNIKVAIKVLSLYLKVSDTFYETQIKKGHKFTKGRLKFRTDVKLAIRVLIWKAKQ